jgi:tetratricopeptide (TPR) repeat protein
MNKKILTILMTVLAICGTSCKKDFLNIVPQDRQVAVNTEDYAKLLNDKRFFYYDFAGGWQGEVLMGDDVSAEGSVYTSTPSVISQKAFQWADDIFQASDRDWTMETWLNSLYTLNKVINEVMDSANGTEQRKKAIQAEAYATRAWLYFQFINFYGKPYQSSTAANDPGFPIITAADVTEKSFTRASVQAVYDFIIQDFTTAIAALPVTSQSAIRFNKAAAEGLLGKVYLFMGKNTEALAAFNDAFTDNAASSVPAKLYDYNIEMASGGKFFPVTEDGPANSPGINYLDVTESVVAKSFYNSGYNGNGFGNDFIVLSSKTRSLFNGSDLRLNFFSTRLPNYTTNPSGRLSKAGVQLSKFGLQISELYLLRAEAKARLNDLTGARADVEALRVKRMPAVNASVPAATASSQPALISFIFNEREREFAAEGYRWFDMRRESVDPIFAGKTYSHLLYNQDGTVTTYTLRNARLTLRLPYYISIANPDMPNNP